MSAHPSSLKRGSVAATAMHESIDVADVCLIEHAEVGDLLPAGAAVAVPCFLTSPTNERDRLQPSPLFRVRLIVV